MYDNFPGLKAQLRALSLKNYLEFGCGRGVFLKLVLDNNSTWQTITAVDIDESAIRQTRELLADYNINYIINHTLPLPVEDAAFDTITLSNVLHHLQDKTGTLQELYRILKPDGRLVVSEMIPHQLSAAEQVHQDFHNLRVKIERHKHNFHDAAYSEQQILSCLESAGFKPGGTALFHEERENVRDPAEIRQMSDFIDRQVSDVDDPAMQEELSAFAAGLKARLQTHGVKRTPQFFVVAVK